MIQNTHYHTGRPALAGAAWRILLQQSFTAREKTLESSPLQCYIHSVCGNENETQKTLFPGCSMTNTMAHDTHSVNLGHISSLCGGVFP